MEDRKSSLGEQVKTARECKGLSQSELAIKCHLNIRTIQRIESNDVYPRLYTMRILSEVLNLQLLTNSEDNIEMEELNQLKKSFRKRKEIRLYLFVSALAILFLALVLITTGMPKIYYAPFIYISMFGILIGIAIVWRCPGCNALLGDVFNTEYCSKCGLHLK